MQIPEVSSLFGDPAGRLRMDSRTQQLTVEPKAQNGSALAGGFAVYHFRVTNEGNVPDSAALETSGNTWPQELSITQTEDLQPDAWVTVIVTASVPVDASRGDSDSATLNVVSESDPSVQDSATMVTTAFAEAGPIYLPGIYRKTGNPFTEWTHSP